MYFTVEEFAFANCSSIERCLTGREIGKFETAFTKRAISFSQKIYTVKFYAVDILLLCINMFSYYADAESGVKSYSL